MTTDFQQYLRRQVAELRPWSPFDDIYGISISPEDEKNGSPKVGDMIARNPKNHADQWLVAAAYFADNFEPMRGTSPAPEPLRLLTSDIGIAIRDLIEDKTIEVDVLNEARKAQAAYAHFIDVSDADNPVIYTDGGTFRVSITRID